jgi:hypothetical protein
LRYIVGGGDGNLELEAKGGLGFGGGVATLLVLASNNLVLFLNLSKKIYNTRQDNVSILHTSWEYEAEKVVEGESLPSSPS